MNTSLKIIGATLLLAVTSFCGTASAGVFTFSNNTSFLIPVSGTSGPSGLFPSTINVSGISNVTDVNVTLLGLSHTYSADLEIYVQGPGGQAVALMTYTGGSANWVNNTVTFSDGGSGIAVGTNGTFNPTGLLSSCSVGAVCGSLVGGLSAFNGIDPTGTWSLYIYDHYGADAGSLSNGWQVTFTADEGVPAPAALALLGLGLLGLRVSRRKLI